MRKIVTVKSYDQFCVSQMVILRPRELGQPDALNERRLLVFCSMSSGTKLQPVRGVDSV